MAWARAGNFTSVSVKSAVWDGMLLRLHEATARIKWGHVWKGPGTAPNLITLANSFWAVRVPLGLGGWAAPVLSVLTPILSQVNTLPLLLGLEGSSNKHHLWGLETFCRRNRREVKPHTSQPTKKNSEILFSSSVSLWGFFVPFSHPSWSLDLWQPLFPSLSVVMQIWPFVICSQLATYAIALEYSFVCFFLSFFLFFFFRFYLFIWQRERPQAGGAAEEEGASRARSQDPRIMTWAKGRHLTDWATQVPCIPFLVYSPFHVV